MSNTFAASPSALSTITPKPKITPGNNLKERRNMKLKKLKQNAQMDRKTINISPYNKTPIIKHRVLNNPGRGTIKDMQRGFVYFN